ncbi:MAG TPA: hypothetical protein VK325_00265 [Pseudoxanthomonas sp.]|nr:hypothetical protein [Pseudoxanthomonas sp.]
MSKMIIAVLLVITASALLPLTSGEEYLEANLPGGLPLGYALGALCLCAAAGGAVGIRTYLKFA